MRNSPAKSSISSARALPRKPAKRPASTLTDNPARPAARKAAPVAKRSKRPPVKQPDAVAVKAATAPVRHVVKAGKTRPAAKLEKLVTAAKPSAAAKAEKLKRRLVRDSFTMPATDYDLIAILKQRALTLLHAAKKSELLRGGLHALAALNDEQFKAMLDGLTPLKPGRPKKAD